MTTRVEVADEYTNAADTNAADTNAGSSPTDLERVVDDGIARFRRTRRDAARGAGRVAQLVEAVDRALRTDAVEYLDRPDYPEHKKLAIVRKIHIANVVTRSYRRFFTTLAPILREVTAREGRPARLLELAGGSGGFAIAIAE